MKNLMIEFPKPALRLNFWLFYWGKMLVKLKGDIGVYERTKLFPSVEELPLHESLEIARELEVPVGNLKAIGQGRYKYEGIGGTIRC